MEKENNSRIEQPARVFGLIGKRLDHSFSQNYFRNKFQESGIKNTDYLLFEMDDITHFETLKQQANIQGFNVTIPYKTAIIPLLDELQGAAAEIQAVNTIQRKGNRWIGHNTDVIGCDKSLDLLIGRRQVKSALILGTGGAAKAVAYCLRKRGIEPYYVSRSAGDFRYEQLTKEDIRAHRLIINCTPLGTFPDINSCPDIPYKGLQRKHLLFDLVYNPEKTLFLNLGEQKHAKILNGLPMLIEQAEAAWTIWNS